MGIDLSNPNQLLIVAAVAVAIFFLFPILRDRLSPKPAPRRETAPPPSAAEPPRYSLIRHADEQGKDLAEGMVMAGVAHEKALEYAGLLQRAAARATGNPPGAPSGNP